MPPKRALANGYTTAGKYAKSARTYAKANYPRKAKARKSTMSRIASALLAVENKFYDTALVGSTINAPTDASAGEQDPSATSMISTPTLGDGEQQRDGKRIVISTVQVTGVINLPQSEALASPGLNTRVFLALVQDTQSNGTQIVSENVYKNLAGNATTAVTPIRNLLFGTRYRVIKAKVFDLTPNTLSHFAVDSFSYNGRSASFNWFQRIDMPVNFNAGTTADIANVIDNSLHIIAYTMQATNAVTLSYNARIRFQG